MPVDVDGCGLDADEPYKKLQRALKAEIDEDAWSSRYESPRVQNGYGQLAMMPCAWPPPPSAHADLGPQNVGSAQWLPQTRG